MPRRGGNGNGLVTNPIVPGTRGAVRASEVRTSAGRRVVPGRRRQPSLMAGEGEYELWTGRVRTASAAPASRAGPSAPAGRLRGRDGGSASAPDGIQRAAGRQGRRDRPDRRGCALLQPA